MKTTKPFIDSIRNALCAGWVPVWEIAEDESAYIMADELSALCDDADRCAEWESLAKMTDESVDAVVVHRGGCAYCDWLDSPVPTWEESQANAATHAKECASHPLGKRIAELEAEVARLRDGILEASDAPVVCVHDDLRALLGDETPTEGSIE